MSEFKKGDLVEVSDDGKGWYDGVFLVYDDISTATEYAYLSHTEEHGLFWSIHCRHRRPDLKVDDPVWTQPFNRPMHFAGWGDDGRILCWGDGRTSHTASHKHAYCAWTKYTTTDPNKEGE